MIVYISGKVSGSNNYERQFQNAEQWLLKKGHKVVNPIKVCKSIVETFAYEQLLNINISILTKCDAIFMLNGWQTSKGAKTELEIAKILGKKIMYQNYFNRNKENKTFA